MDPVEPGLSCGSDTAHMSIFGYDPFTLYRGRGAFETMGSGIPMTNDDIAFKCNFAHMDPTSGKVLLRRVDRNFDKWGLPLIDCLDNMVLSIFEENDTKLTAKHATEHRIGLKITSRNLSDQITGTDPLKDNLPL
jgi:2,3-bisphosphoglycerate-independent phosphoglycerate mutase